MKARKFTIIIILLMSFISFGGCLSNEITLSPDNSGIAEYISNVSFPSLETVLPKLNQEVTRLDGTAQLDRIAFELSNLREDKRILYAVYLSMKDDQTYYFVEYFADERIEIKERRFNLPNEDSLVILPGSWSFDSNEAWKMFTQHLGKEQITEGNLECGNLMLIFKEINDSQRLVWKLALKDCLSEDIVQYHLDAITGEYLGSD